ncbi:MAG: dihydrofolate reductase family protein [Candidatus Nanopelagicales bacterium]
MGEVIATQFVTLDGVVSDPDGRWGSDHGGWAFRYGAGPVADDKFRLGDRLTDGCQLYGRRTWEHFSRLWPSRTGPFAERMNDIPKFVVTSSGIDADAWSRSTAILTDPLGWVSEERRRRDVMVIGSTQLLHALADADLVDEYRLVTFPIVLGAGEHLFRAGSRADLRFVSVEPNDAEGITTLTILRRDAQL